MDLYDIPEYMHDGLHLYVEKGIPPGTFLERVLCNDFVGAVGHADINNIQCFPAYARVLMMEIPAACWGSQETVDSWIQQGGKGA